jgi:hypothetical protein
MGGTAWFLVAFGAVVVMILVTVWVAMVLEAGEQAERYHQDLVAAGSRAPAAVPVARSARAADQARAHPDRSDGS